ncbi:MAG TPA: YciI family protein [Mucilaginibacter sp.]
MKDFIVLVREPDGRADEHTAEELKLHREKWDNWFAKYSKSGHFKGGSALSLNGKIIKGVDATVINDIHKIDSEIIGGYLLLKAEDLNEAVEIAREIPVFEFEGYLEVRELQVDQE